MRRKIPMAVYILVAMGLGIVVGYMVFTNYPDKATATRIAGYISIGSDVFLRLIKMLIGPLVFSLLMSIIDIYKQSFRIPASESEVA